MGKDSEYYQEWINDEDLRHNIEYEEYEEMREAEDWGYDVEIDDDDDSYDNY